jgi:predicted DNA-binding antitoxin AbrB/MazE fold protein
MKIQAIYENGVLKPTKPLPLRRKLVTIQIPDEELVEPRQPASPKSVFDKYNLSPEVRAMAEEMIAELDAIRNAPLPPDEELPPVSQKQIERFEAFALRDNR